MEIIRKELTQAELFPDDIRYDEGTDTVQRRVNGDWIDSPESDPRVNNYFPPKTGSSAACDSAANIVVNLQGLVDGIVTAVCGGAVAYGIGTYIIGILTIFSGLFGVLLLLAIAAGSALVSLGCGDLGTAFTSGTWDTLLCILKCRMNTSGQLTAISLSAVRGDIDSQIGGTAATVLNLLFDIIGFGGLNAMGASGAETGDCDDCGCGQWCYTWDMKTTNADWTPVSPTTYQPGSGWAGGFLNSASQEWAYIHISFADTLIDSIGFGWCKSAGSGSNNSAGIICYHNGAVVFIDFPPGGIGCPTGMVRNIGVVCDEIWLNINSGTSPATGYIEVCTVYGEDTCPFGTPNC